MCMVVRREVVESRWDRLADIASGSTADASKHSSEHERAISHWLSSHPQAVEGAGGLLEAVAYHGRPRLRSHF